MSIAHFDKGMTKLNKLIEDLGFMDISLSNCKFTWSRLDDDSLHSLLDRFLVSKQRDMLFDNPRVSRHIFSDHFPLLLEAGSFAWGLFSLSLLQ